MLLTKWENWDAYKLGLINVKGERIKEKKLTTSEEKNSWDFFTRFVARVKRLFERFLGKSKLTALFSMAVLFREMEKQGLKLDKLDENEYIKTFNFIEEEVLNNIEQ